jgi:hypothetical protein
MRALLESIARTNTTVISAFLFINKVSIVDLRQLR